MAAQKSFNKFSVAVIVSIVVIQCLGVAASSTCIGCLELDELTFDKILKKFPTVLVKFDIAYPYGDKHEAYAKLAAEVSPTNGDFAVAVVGIKDYGNKENSQLAERFSVGDKYPVIKLFRNGNANEWIDYPKGEVAPNGPEYFWLIVFGVIFRSQCDGGQSSAIRAATLEHLHGTERMPAEV